MSRKRHGVQGGPTDTGRPDSLTGALVRPMVVKTKRGQALKIVGYYTQGKAPNWTRLKEYRAWKDHVRDSLEGIVPRASARHPVRVDVWCYFASGVHPDPENVRKGIVDALFPGGDKHVYGYHHHPLYSDAPHVLVEISGGLL